MESIEKLREWAADEHTVCRGLEMETFTGKLSSYEKYALGIVIDWLEREIAEKYTLLPVDADGVPWSMTDGEFDDIPEGLTRLELDMIAYSVKTGKWYLLDDGRRAHSATTCRHVESDPIKELLEEFGDRVARSGHQWGLDAPAIIDEYAGKFGEFVR